MSIENWALPIFKKVGFKPKKAHPIARSAVERACCEVRFYNFGLQPETNVLSRRETAASKLDS